MKALVFLLVLANLLFYAFSSGYFGHPDNPDGERSSQQVKPERIRIVSRGEAPVAAAPPPEAPPAEEPKPEAAVAVAPVCLLWEHLAVADADRLAALLTDKFGDFKLVRQAHPGEGNGWWVYIPPLASKAEAERKAAELRVLGVADYFLIQEGPNRFAISLGIFSAEKGGLERMSELKAKGVRSARLTQRPGKDGAVTLRATGPAGGQAGLIATLGEAFPKITTETCK